MFKFIFVVLILAGYGAYSLVSNLWSDKEIESPSAVQVPSVVEQDSGMPALASLPLSLVDKLEVDIRELPETGCTQSVLTREKANALLDAVPEGMRQNLYEALALGELVWSAQLYLNEDGVGVCLPGRDRLIMLPGVKLPIPTSRWSVENIKHKVTKVSESATQWLRTNMKP